MSVVKSAMTQASKLSYVRQPEYRKHVHRQASARTLTTEHSDALPVVPRLVKACSPRPLHRNVKMGDGKPRSRPVEDSGSQSPLLYRAKNVPQRRHRYSLEPNIKSWNPS